MAFVAACLSSSSVSLSSISGITSSMTIMESCVVDDGRTPHCTDRRGAMEGSALH